MPFAIQPLRSICCTLTAAYVRGPRFVLVADLATETQIIRLSRYRGDDLSSPCKQSYLHYQQSYEALLMLD